jgi:hypothetical protein
VPEQYIPAWLVSVSAFVSAWTLWLVRPMPLRIRISIIAPLVYLGALYLIFTFITLSEPVKATFVRLGLMIIFIPIIANSIVVRLQWRKGRV